MADLSNLKSETYDQQAVVKREIIEDVSHPIYDDEYNQPGCSHSDYRPIVSRYNVFCLI
jgi:hypothetical protein